MSDANTCILSFQRDGETITHAVRGASAVVGRSSECDVVIPEIGISRMHARVELDGGAWKIIDLESVNGMFVNGVRVSAARLCSGDRIMLGQIGIDVLISGESMPAGPGGQSDVSGRATLVFETVAEERVVSVMFGYLDNFSMIVEGMPAPAVALLLNSVFERIAEIAEDLGGTICTIAGDGFMAFFGGSATREDHAERATEGAWRMRAAVESMGRKVDTNPRLSMRFGINSGASVIGEIGPTVHRQYTVVGDTVGVALRLAYMTAMTSEILVGKATHDAIGEQFACRALPPQKARGRRERIDPFVVEERL